MEKKYFLLGTFLLIACALFAQDITFEPDEELFITADLGTREGTSVNIVSHTEDLRSVLIEVTGTDAGEFSLPFNTDPDGNPRPSPLQEMDTTEVLLMFDPSSLGTKYATLQIYVLDEVSEGVVDTVGTHSINVVGTALVPIAPEIVFLPGDLIEFGDVNAGSTAVQTVTIENHGNTDLTITNLEVIRTGAFTSADQFKLKTPVTLPLVIDTTESVTLELSFTSTSPADYNAGSTGDIGTRVAARLRIESNDPEGVSAVELRANETEPDIRLVETSIDYDSVSLGTDSIAHITLVNKADGFLDGDWVITGVNFSGLDAGLFSTTTAFPITVSPGDTMKLPVTFAPEAVGAFSSTVSIEGNATGQVALHGVGTARVFDIITSFDHGSTMTSYDYGNIVRGDINNDAVFYYQVTGGEDVALDSIAVTGTGVEDFNSLYIQVPRVLRYGDFPGAMLRVDPRSTTSLGQKAVTITFYSNAINGPHTLEVSWNVVSPEATVSHDKINLGDIVQGTTMDTTFIVKNSGTSAFTISSAELTGPNADQFSITDFSGPLTVEPGDSTTLTVQCAPVSARDSISAAVVLANENNISIPKIFLKANVLAPAATLLDEALDFGDAFSTVEANNGSFTVVNTGTANLIVSAINISGTHTSAFSLDAVALPVTIPVGDSLEVGITFNPQSSGIKNALVAVESNDVSGPATFTVAGRGIEPVVTMSSSINIGNVPVNRNSSKVKVDVSNAGQYPLEITGVTIAGEYASLFALVDPTAMPITVAPGETTSFYVTFHPLEVGTFSAQLEIQSNDLSASPTVSALSGSGMLAPEATAVEDTVFFPAIDFGQYISKYIVIRNTGSADLELLRAYNIVNSHGFSMPMGFPRNLPPGDTAMFRINFSTSSYGAFYSTFEFQTNDPITPSIFVACIGYAKGPVMTLSRSSLAFDAETVGNTDTLSVTVSNIGDDDLTLVYDRPNDQARFSVRYQGVEYPSTMPTYITLTVPPGESRVANVLFRPDVVGEITGSVNIVSRGAFNNRVETPIAVTGIGKEPESITVGGVTLHADAIIQDGVDKRILRGRVHSDKLKFTGDVLVNLATKEITGTGDVYMTDIPKVGNYGGEVVKLQEGGFKYTAEDKTAELIIQGGLSGVSGAFKLMGIPLEITKFSMIPDGIRVGANLTLPEEVFGPNAGVFIDSLEITTTKGVQIVGKASLSPQLKVKNLINLNKAFVAFNTYEDYFEGSGEIGFNLLNRKVTLGAGIVIRKGMLDAVTMEIEVNPGIPLGATGWSLAGGNGFIKGLQTPPIALGLGVDLVPAVTAAGMDIVRMENMTISYTFGTSFEGGGTLQVFGQNVGGGKISVSLHKISAQAFINLYQIFSGNINAAITFENNAYSVEGSARMGVTIPKLENCSVCDMFPGLLPYKIAEASVYFNNKKISADVSINLIAFRVGIGVALIFENPNVRTEVGANISLLNGRLAGASGRMRNYNGSISFEHDEAAIRKNRLEGQSIILGTIPNGRTKGTLNDLTEFPFETEQTYKTLFVRVTGDNTVPDFSVILPTGQEVTADNAESLGIYHVTNEDKDLRAYVMNNAIAGAYKLRIKGSGRHEVDFFGIGFGPELSIEKVDYDKTSNELNIGWKDEDRDSNASISWFYDIDQTGADGRPIVRGVAEDDETDSFTWVADSIKNGTYYIYGVIDDGTNTPLPVYFSEPFTINQPSPIPAPALEIPVIDNDTIRLSWTAVEDASQYLIYFDEDTVTFNSRNINVGDRLQYEIATLEKGRDYRFAVSAMTSDFVESNLSNRQVLEYVSTETNNVPEITETVFPGRTNVGEPYEASVTCIDADAEDVLTLSLTEAPVGMSVNQDGTIHWTAGDNQVGRHQVIVQVTDSHGATDSASFVLSVLDENSSLAALSLNDYRFNGADEEAIVTLVDPGLNTAQDAYDRPEITLYSGFEKNGISLSLEETGVNTGIFKGAFTFGPNDSDASGRKIGVQEVDTVFVVYQDQNPNRTVSKYVLYETAEVLNRFPVAVSLNNTVILGHQVNDIVGIFSTVDPDKGDVHSYRLVDGVGSDDNEMFYIDGSSLKVQSQTLEDSVYRIRVRATDSRKGYFEQAFVLKNGRITGVAQNHLSNRVHIYPNPASRRIVVKLGETDHTPLKVTLLTSNGIPVRSQEVTGDKLTMDISDLSSGIYLIQVDQKGQTVVKQLVKK